MNLTPTQVNYAESAQWKQSIRQALADTRCASPAFLTDDISTDQTVTVQIAIQERVRTSGGAQWWDIPPITNVPVMMPRGGGYSMTLPLKKGDQGLLIFCDTCFDTWWQNGQENAPPAQNPAPWPFPVPSGSQTQLEVRRHHVHDCGFFPGLWSQNNLIPNFSTDSLQIRRDDGTAVIDISNSGVAITGSNVKLQADDLATSVQVVDGTVTITSPDSTAGSLIVGTALHLPGTVDIATGGATNYLPVTIGGMPYKLLLQPG